MNDQNIPAEAELPSTQTLLRSTVLAALVAGLLLVTAVLPAEYGIDPTGVGRALGLQQMGEMKVLLAQEAAAGAASSAIPAAACDASGLAVSAGSAPVAGSSADVATHEMHVTLAPNEATEIKVTMAKGRSLEYSWSSNGDAVNYDVHGDSKKLDINYHRYSKGAEKKSGGVLEAAFDGRHGWYWKNRTRETVTITLRTSGSYTDIRRMN